MNSNIREKIKKHKIIPVIAIEHINKVLPLADALIAGGLPLIEITFRTAIAAEAIALLSKERPEILVGAGTVLTAEELKSAIEKGAAFAVAPGFNPNIVELAEQNSFPFMPGILTPSDLEAGMAMGIEVFKFFPAEAAGGTSYIKSLIAPYAHKNIQLIPTGGVNTANLLDYLNIKEIIAVGGTWIAKKEQIENGQWEVIKNNCQSALQLLSK